MFEHYPAREREDPKSREGKVAWAPSQGDDYTNRDLYLEEHLFEREKR